MRHAAILADMDYAEFPAPRDLRHLAKATWTLSVPASASANVSHIATPDGCMEIIRRTRGRSWWNGEQPTGFVAGLITHPAELRLSRDSHFIGLRLWPWAWNLIGQVGSRALVDHWADLADAAPDFALPDSVETAFAALDSAQLTPELVSLVEAILASSSVGDLAKRTGRSNRWLQRWFERHIGVSPRSYLRLLRFSSAFERLPGSDATLAGHAAEHGFADQSHMAREFRSMSGTSAARAKSRASGPFL